MSRFGNSVTTTRICRGGKGERRTELLAAYEASGLTQSAFARREGINFHTFVAWLGQRRKAGAAAPEVRFRESVPAADGPSGTAA